ncbi:MAG: hypothetical protein WAU58_19920 [Terriglobales bacterium]
MLKRYLTLILVLFSTFALAATPDAVDAGKTTANVFESTFFHFRYEFPNGWVALDDKVRMAENKKRYDDDLKEAQKQNGPDTKAFQSEVVNPYFLLVAGYGAVITSTTTQKPRIVIMATKRRTMMTGPHDPARTIIKMIHPKVLKGPEDIVLAGRPSSRTDLELHPGSLLSTFATVVGDYIIEFDLRADNEKDLANLVNTMETVQFTDH